MIQKKKPPVLPITSHRRCYTPNSYCHVSQMIWSKVSSIMPAAPRNFGCLVVNCFKVHPNRDADTDLSRRCCIHSDVDQSDASANAAVTGALETATC